MARPVRNCAICGTKVLKSEIKFGKCPACSKTKKCMWCEQELPLKDFNTVDTEDDGLDYFCKPCRIYVDNYKQEMARKYTHRSSSEPFSAIQRGL